MEDKILQGQFQIPGKEGEECGGKVEFTPEDGVLVKLFNIGDELFVDKTPDRVRQIVGMSTDAEPIRLHQCSRKNISSTSGSLGRAKTKTYHAQSMFVGYPFINNNPAFDDLEVYQPLLADWADLSGPVTNLSDVTFPASKPGDILRVEYTQPDLPSVRINGIEIEIATKPTTNMGQVDLGQISVEVFWRITPRKNQVPFSQYMRTVQNLQDLLSFALAQPVGIWKLIGNVDIPYESKDVEISYQPSPNIKQSDGERAHNVLFRLDDVHSSFEEILKTWFEKSEVLTPVFHLYFATQDNSAMYVQNKLLNLTQALETYHRRSVGGTYLSEQEYEDVYQDLITFLNGQLGQRYGLKNDFTTHLRKGTFRHANEYSLGKRLGELISEHEGTLRELHWNLIGKERAVVDTRNYLTHYDEKGKAVLGKEQIHLVWGLQQLVEVCLLAEMGIPENHVVEQMSDRYRDREIK
ncbi:hypothetical protein NDI76_19655 [Halogeometricum sp. S1BR25-6]|uniref:ApeA N-terminal domain-containing protein n=1 Tax=Halogeometricum salsisoli TaxID=2950536 RepID=A0ABU2GKQ4_9EURY|nr:HEPN domain-containing protein [Halogeometricum sp. S1BR25-6]MDS0300966.1 hypothetical protein [Halogeometricum sp. S1BR25-6]